jgi:hypothetical protein
MTKYSIQIDTARDIPDDVLVEHLAHAVRQIVDPAKKRDRRGRVDVTLSNVDRGRAHPFEGPEVNDDLPEDDDPEVEYTADGRYARGGYLGGGVNVNVTSNPPDYVIPASVIRAIGEDFPFLTELFRDKRNNAQPPAEGDWQLPEDGDTAGGDK